MWSIRGTNIFIPKVNNKVKQPLLGRSMNVYCPPEWPFLTHWDSSNSVREHVNSSVPLIIRTIISPTSVYRTSMPPNTLMQVAFRKWSQYRNYTAKIYEWINNLFWVIRIRFNFSNLAIHGRIYLKYLYSCATYTLSLTVKSKWTGKLLRNTLTYW